MTESTTHRPLWQIAREITADWTKVNYAAKPYLDAMNDLDQITDVYGLDRADIVVLYFLSNSGSWRGEKAIQIKNELKTILTNKTK